MFILILQSAIISAIFIFLIHYLVKFFKNTLTTPKIKDFVTLPAQKYKKMFDTMNGGSNHQNTNDNAHDGSTIIEPMLAPEDMKNELKNFMKKHLTPTSSLASASDSSSMSTPLEDIAEFSFSNSGDFMPLSSTFSNF
jgi:hypothetical protein